MATLDSLKQNLRQKATATTLSTKRPLSDIQYSTGFDTLVRGSGWTTYQDFVIPQLSHLLALLFNSRIHIPVLEIGPWPKSVFGYLPSYLRQKVRRYASFEPNGLFATKLEEWLCSTSETESPLPCLESSPNILRIAFVLDSNIWSGIGAGTKDSEEKFDVIFFCHSKYCMKPKHKFIERALQMLVERPEGEMVVAFHRDWTLHLYGLLCHRTTSLPTGTTCVANDDEVPSTGLFCSFHRGVCHAGFGCG